jgi:sugar fermentation stimulation protein A
VVDLQGLETRVHINDPGRLKELLFPGAPVVLRPAGTPERKTAFSLVAVRHGPILVSVDSQLPNRFVGELLGTDRWPPFQRARDIKREVRVDRSRLDFSFEKEGEKWFAEVKGCTLVRDGTALFPDAPTLRGARHLRELADLSERGFRTAVFFVIQRSDAVRFAPNVATDPLFARGLREAADSGVVVRALAANPVLGRGLDFKGEVPVSL